MEDRTKDITTGVKEGGEEGGGKWGEDVLGFYHGAADFQWVSL